MKVLALDIAANAGWAVLAGSDVVACGSIDLGEGIRTRSNATKRHPATPENTRDAIKTRRLRLFVAQLLIEHGCAFVVVEKDTGQGKAAVTLARLQGAAHEAALEAGIPSVSVQLTSWRRRIHGSDYVNETAAMKDAAMRMCAEGGVAVPDADAAEAVLIGRDAVAVGLERLQFEEANPKSVVERRERKARKIAREAKKAAAAAAPKRRRAA